MNTIDVKPGPAKREGSITADDKKTIALRPDQWEFVKLYAAPGSRDDFDPETGKVRWGSVLRTAVDRLKRYERNGPGATPERDSKGLFITTEGRRKPARANRRHLANENTRLRALLENAGIDPDGK